MRPLWLCLLLSAVAGCSSSTSQATSRPALSRPGDAAAAPSQSRLGPCQRIGGVPVLESEGVRAREGECIAARVYAVAPGVAGLPSPEAAIHDHGFGRDALGRLEVDRSGPETRYEERDGSQVVGRYGVRQTDSGGWVLVSFVASIRP